MVLAAIAAVPGTGFAGTEETAPGVTKSNLGVIRGIVFDQAGKPIADATVAIFRVGTSKLLRQVRSTADGRFLLKILPGTYTVLAVAEGYNPATLSEIQIGRAAEVDYGFKLERSGSGNTLPEKRLDRNNTKWVRRSASLSRSIYQNQDGPNAIDETAVEAENAAQNERSQPGPGTSVVETYFASGERGDHAGVNYATLLRFGQKADVLIAGQAGIGRNAPQRVESELKFRPNDTHQIRFRASVGQLGTLNIENEERTLGQLSVQALDEWRVREGVIVVYGLDYSRFIGAGDDASISPRLGLQFDVDPKTRLRAAYTTATDDRTWSREIELEDAQVIFREPVAVEDVLIDSGRPQLNKSSRFEFGIERVLDNRSSIEANAFFDTTFSRGVGLVSMPFDSSSSGFNEFVGNQQGGAQGVRVVYSRRISGRLSASGGYSFGTGQRLSAAQVSNPAELFEEAVFQTVFGQFEADLHNGTNVKTIFRLSPQATVFAIDPFQGRLAIYDPSLSILVTQNLPTLGLPFTAEAIVDARNIFDFQTGAAGEDGLLKLSGNRRMIRGGILVRF